MDHERINPGHGAARSVLRVAGPVIAIVGLIFAAVGLIDFFGAFGGGGFPTKFWCLFVGLPLIGIGVGITKFAYLGTVLRYMAGESAPVGKDVFNYMAEGTAPGVRTAARAAGAGFSEGFAAGGASLHCRACGAEAEPDAKFCDQCGGEIVGPVACAKCGADLEPDARFCDQCGATIGK